MADIKSTVLVTGANGFVGKAVCEHLLRCGANVKGATLLSESLSEYSSLKVLEKEYGKFQMRKFLKEALDSYLQGRTSERKEENPLMYNENQQYIHYNKGSLVLYAMSDYLGEKRFNDVLKEYVAKVKFQEAPYTNSIEFVNHLKANTPANLQYLITDMFETITLYDNKVDKVAVKPLKDGKYQVDISFIVSKRLVNPLTENLSSITGAKAKLLATRALIGNNPKLGGQSIKQ